MLLSNSKNCPAKFHIKLCVLYEKLLFMYLIYTIATHRLLVENKIRDTNKSANIHFHSLNFQK